ncbi:MAG: hypothetical protein LBU30_01155, partial [Candidatus Methanoplasma sp.]|nr:hypothetical protein [Candidatus Methanoplasma sp.]
MIRNVSEYAVEENTAKAGRDGGVSPRRDDVPSRRYPGHHIDAKETVRTGTGMKEPKKAKLVRMGGMDQNRAVKELLDHPPDTILKAPPKVWKPEPIETVRKAQKWTAPPTSDEQAAMNMYSMDRYQQTNISLEREIAYDKQVVQD